MSEKVRLWNKERKSWWRPNSHGYTETEAEAGVYTREAAEAIIKGTHDENEIRELVHIGQVSEGGAYLRDLIPTLQCHPDMWARHYRIAGEEGLAAVVFWSERAGLQWRDTSKDVKVRFGQILTPDWKLGSGDPTSDEIEATAKSSLPPVKEKLPPPKMKPPRQELEIDLECEAHKNIEAPGLCPVCLIEERDTLREKLEDENARRRKLEVALYCHGNELGHDDAEIRRMLEKAQAADLKKIIAEKDEQLKTAEGNLERRDRRLLKLKEELAERQRDVAVIAAANQLNVEAVDTERKRADDTEARLAGKNRDLDRLIEVMALPGAVRSAPKPPLCVIHDVRYGGQVCPECSSDYPRRFWLVGRRYCVNDKCSLSRKNAPNIPDPPDLPREFSLEVVTPEKLPGETDTEWLSRFLTSSVTEHLDRDKVRLEVKQKRMEYLEAELSYVRTQLGVVKLLHREDYDHLERCRDHAEKLKEENEQLKCEAEIEEKEATARQLKLAAAEFRRDELTIQLDRAEGHISLLTTANEKHKQELSDAQLTAKRREHNRDEALACNRQLLEDVGKLEQELKAATADVGNTRQLLLELAVAEVRADEQGKKVTAFEKAMQFFRKLRSVMVVDLFDEKLWGPVDKEGLVKLMDSWTTDMDAIFLELKEGGLS